MPTLLPQSTWPSLRLEGESLLHTTETLAPERPLDMRIDGETLALTLCSPGSDRELALGQFFSEGLIDAATDVVAMTQGESQGPEPVGKIAFIDAILKPKAPFLRTTGPDEILRGSASLSRHGAQNSACGLCGKTEWPIPAKPWAETEVTHALPMSLARLEAAFQIMRETQSGFSHTGGSHAAAAFAIADEGAPQLLAAHEDVGRHNAVDKVVGALLARNLIGRDQEPHSALPYLLCVSGRIAYEIITKAYRAGFKILAAVGAPSTLAVAHAQSFGLTLVGFCREGRATVYTHPERMALPHV